MNKDLNDLYKSLVFSFLFTLLVVVVSAGHLITGNEIEEWAVLPLQINHLQGIVLHVLVHGSWEHLFSNCIALWVLLFMSGYFYGRNYLWLVAFLLVSEGLILWFIGRKSLHIGASGFIYALFSFVVISGLVIRNLRLVVASLIVILFYGSMVWGVLPVDSRVSWEGHLSGVIAGVLGAVLFRKNYRIQYPKEYIERLQEEDDSNEDEYSRFEKDA